jgi:L-ascorbate metabolism protein UlaG (beta-lactamase superfamily)
MMPRGLLPSVALACCAAVGCAATPAAVSPRFDGTRFRNPEPGHSAGATLRWLWQMKTVSWPGWIRDPPRPRPPGRVARGELRVTYINHATVLIQAGGVNVLTDPIWFGRAGPFSWLGARRVRAPGLPLDALPPIDVVLVSHDHYDHLDLRTLEALRQRHRARYVAGLGVGRRLAAAGIRDAVELDWWQAWQAPGVRITFVPARHGSGRAAPFTTDRTLWGGFIIETAAGQVYFAGDTALGSFVAELRGRFATIRLAILPIGSYEKRWFMATQHMNPDDAVRAHLALGAAQSMGMHYATFAEHPEQAIDAHERDLAAALRAHGVPPDRFWILGFGEGRDVPPWPTGRAASATVY